jgi:hypothetical protein
LNSQSGSALPLRPDATLAPVHACPVAGVINQRRLKDVFDRLIQQTGEAINHGQTFV